jgi:hypothetical protein
MDNIIYTSKKVLEEEGTLLLKLQETKNDGRGVSCVKTIAAYLLLGKFEPAKTIRQLDGDKTRQYEDIEDELLRFFGCRIHGKHGCMNYLCLSKTSYPKEGRASK